MKIIPFFKLLILHEQARACTHSMKGIEMHLTQPKKKKKSTQIN